MRVKRFKQFENYYLDSKRISHSVDRKSMVNDEWMKEHPLQGVKINGHDLVATDIFYFDEGDFRLFTAKFNDGYINLHITVTKKGDEINTKKPQGKLQHKEVLVTWIHKAMIHLSVPLDMMEALIKNIQAL